MINPYLGVGNWYALFTYLVNLKKKLPHFGSVEPVFKGQTQWHMHKSHVRMRKSKCFYSSIIQIYMQNIF
jgi:hypothetical protein